MDSIVWFVILSRPLRDADDKVASPANIQAHKSIYERQLIFSDQPSLKSNPAS